MDLFLRPGHGPLAAQLYEQLREAIATGRLRPQDQLVPSRVLAQQLGLSRYTVATAYGRLADEGYILGRAGGGSVVAPDATAQASARPGSAIVPSAGAAAWRPDLEAAAPLPDRLDLRPGFPDPALFPLQDWRRALARAAVRLEGTGDPRGEPELRATVARWVGRSRGVSAGVDAVLVTSGAHHAVDLVARVMVRPGDTVAMENPGYAPVARLFEALGLRVAGVPVDAQGLVVEAIPDDARLVYVTPSHQFPLGVTMSLARRHALLSWAGTRGAAILEDDYDSEFRYADRPLEPLHRLDEAGRVVYVGSFSKTLSPSLRLGFAVVPPSLAAPAAALRQRIDRHPPLVTQLALAELIESGRFERHLRRARRAYAQRRAALDAALAGADGCLLEPIAAAAGLHVTAWLAQGIDERRVLEAADRLGLALSGLAPYDRLGAARPGLVLGLGGIAAAAVPTAVAALGRALADARGSTP